MKAKKLLGSEPFHSSKWLETGSSLREARLWNLAWITDVTAGPKLGPRTAEDYGLIDW